MDNSTTTVRVTWATKARLLKAGTMADTMDSLINRLLDEASKRQAPRPPAVPP